MCKCSKCNSTNTDIVAFIDRIEDENLYQYQCEDCGYTFLGSVKLNDMERITAILKEFNNTEITNINECIKACEGAWSKIANISSQWEAQMGLNNVYKDDLDVLENYIKELKNKQKESVEMKNYTVKDFKKGQKVFITIQLNPSEFRSWKGTVEEVTSSKLSEGSVMLVDKHLTHGFKDISIIMISDVKYLD